MKAPRTALGVDISADRISLVLLARTPEGITILKVASAPVPPGAAKNGSVEDPEKLAKVIKDLRTSNGIPGAHPAAVTLFADPTVVQLLDIPTAGSINVGQFVRNEMRSCVALSGQELTVDFCRTTSGQGLKGRLLAVASDSQKTASLAGSCQQAGLNTIAIEPPLLAVTRALYAKKIAGQLTHNVLITLWREGALTLCVFRDMTLDLVRVRQPSDSMKQGQEIGRWMAEEINEIIGFYQMEVAEGPRPWDVTVVSHNEPLSGEATEALKSQIDCASLQVGTDQTLYEQTPLSTNPRFEGASVVAMGLAMKLLNADDHRLRINLVPPESAEVRSFKRHCLLTANVVASIALLLIVAGAGLSLMANTLKTSVSQRRVAAMPESAYALSKQQEQLDREIHQISDRPARLDNIVSAHPDVDWAGILEDIRRRTPQTVRITNLYSRGQNQVHMEGEASKYEAVHLFVKLLNESRYIDSASLVDAAREEIRQGLVAYTITCSLVSEKKRAADGRL